MNWIILRQVSTLVVQHGMRFVTENSRMNGAKCFGCQMIFLAFIYSILLYTELLTGDKRETCAFSAEAKLRLETICF